MTGTIEGGRRAAQTNYKKYGADFYSRIGQKGGRLGHTGGFASDKIGADGLTGRMRARTAGALGGHISKRGRSKASRTKEAKGELNEGREV